MHAAAGDRFPLEPPLTTWPVRDVENLYVPLPDGTRLAARAWLPHGAPPAPAILEVLPYRKRDATRPRDETLHPVFAAAGHPSLRVDVRGTGDSDGILLDEYHPQEIEDGLALLRWVAAQPFCDGRVILMGKSWGGIAALMIATHAPRELAGVVSVCATDDRYGNDAHYEGGRLLVENLVWGVGLMAVVAHPPDPRLAGAAWRETWRARLASLVPFPSLWMAHPRRDAYWSRDSAREGAGRIRCPVLLFGGLDDPYRDAIPRLLAELGGPRSGVIGPWAHRYPHLGVPGPALDFAGEVLDFIARHLGGDPPPDAARPPLLLYVTEGRRRPPPADREGRWIALPGWPPSAARSRTLGLTATGLVAAASAPGALSIDAPIETGLDAGGWCGFGQVGEGPFDQSDDDRRSCCFETPTTDDALAIVGTPRFVAVAHAPGGRGLLAVRLCEVFPDGHSERLAYGVADVSGDRTQIDLPLSFTSHRLTPGSRLRLAIANAMWPIVWPHPEDGPVVLDRGSCSLVLPLEPAETAPLPPGFPRPPPPGLPPAPDPEAYTRTVSREPTTGAVTLRTRTDVQRDGAISMGMHPEIRLAHGHAVEERYTLRPGDRRSAVASVTHRFRLEVPGTILEAYVTGTLENGDGTVRFTAEMHATENGRTVASRRW